MMAHSPVAWEHVTFKDVVVKVSSADQYYRAMRFYLEVGLGTGFGARVCSSRGWLHGAG
jgi:hypothetical protein